ncbi:DUF3971 domain-containing protein [uncultured Tateyamaria sp.]|uniref:YhdP family protein n=1 Tax=uncultured Tateyamaria sp. TaxID=455651 RepID=UPI0026336CE8|nr:DUF3971 domain-containing protein [uncultured Tateyamaria sp.]
MSSADPINPPPPVRRKRLWRRLGLGSLVMSLMTAVVLGALIYVLMGRPVSAPAWLHDQIELRADEAINEGQLRFDALDLVVVDGMMPQVRMSNVQLVTETGAEIVAFGELTAGLSLTDLLRGQIRPARISISGIFVNLQRQADGSVRLSGGLDLSAPTREAATLAQLIGGIDELLTRDGLGALTEADIRALTLRVEDLQSGRAWTIDGGRMRLLRDDDTVRITSDLALLSGGQGVATLAANYESEVGATEAKFGIAVADIASGDIATLAPAFAWLDVLRAPISGAMRGGVNAQGGLAPLNASLTIGEGVVQPNDAARPVPFQSARTYFNYDPVEGVLAFDELSVESAWITARLDGQTVLGIGADGQLDDLVGQFQASVLSANPDDIYAEPVSFEAAEMDFRLALDPFRLDVGQALFQDQGQMLLARGTLTAGGEGWSYGLDAQMDGLSPERLLALWPERVIPPTRKWLVENLKGGRLSNLDLVLRDTPSAPTTAYASFDYDEAHVRYVKTLPPVTGARGTASLLGNRFVVSVDAGQVRAPQGGIVEVGGSSFIIPDVTAREGAPAVVRVEAAGTVTAALSLLDQPPLSIMNKADLSPGLADGRLQLAGTLALPLRRGIKTSDLEFDATGTARNVVSTTLIEGRTLASDTLRVVASNTGVTVAGKGTLDGVPYDATWTQPLAQTPQPSRVEGTIELSERTIDAFRIGLPAGLVRGQGVGNITVDLPLGGAVPRFTLATNLRGLRLSSPPLGWSKSAGTAGSLTLSGALGATPRVDQLTLDAPGLRATGSITLTPGGGLELARFTDVRVGDWLRAPVDLVGRGRNAAPAVAVRGGTLDLRRADFGGAGSGTGGQQGGGPLSLALDRLTITDTIALTGMSGEFNMARGLDGSFNAQVNGGTAIRGQVLPQNGRSAIRITGQDAGGVARSAGILKQARGGDLSLTLLPVGAASFDGSLRITETRIQDAPAIAALLNAVSIVGLLEQLGGNGIHFQEVEAAFRLTPSTMALTQASAVGPSLGLSMDGTYDVTRSILDMQGVISPIFILNGLGSIFTRKGEGLIGFNYRLRGPAASPQVQVNPLSALTPGMFREIFRAPAPELPEVDGGAGSPTRPEAFAPPQQGETRAQRRLRERQERLDQR